MHTVGVEKLGNDIAILAVFVHGNTSHIGDLCHTGFSKKDT